MELSIQERLKDLRVERGLTLEQLAEQRAWLDAGTTCGADPSLQVCAGQL